MFINKETADERVSSDENLVNVVLEQSRSSLRSDRIKSEEDFPIPAEIVTEDEADSLRSSKELDILGTVKQHHPGRPNGSKGVPDEFKVAAGLMAHFNSVRDVASALGIDKITVHSAKHGQSSYGRPDEELKSKIEQDLSTVRDKALDRLLSSLDLLDDEKIAKCNAKDTASVSASMAKVMAMTLPKDVEQSVRAQLIVYAPTQVTEQKFEVVEI